MDSAAVSAPIEVDFDLDVQVVPTASDEGHAYSYTWVVLNCQANTRSCATCNTCDASGYPCLC